MLFLAKQTGIRMLLLYAQFSILKYALFPHKFWAISNQMEQSYGQKTFLQIKLENMLIFHIQYFSLILLCKF